MKEWVFCPIRDCTVKILTRGKTRQEIYDTLKQHLLHHSLFSLQEAFEDWLLELLDKQLKGCDYIRK